MKRELLPLVALVAVVGMLVLGSGCGFGADAAFRPACTSDDQCTEGQVCFPDGCGDPGKDIRVEVTPNVQQGYHAQDFGIGPGFEIEELRPQQNLVVLAPSAIAGRVERSATGSMTINTFPYSGTVSFNIIGESALIPGLRRRFSSTVTVSATDPGTYNYKVPVASGVFSVSLASADTSIPPSTELSATVQPGGTAEATFVLPASSEVFRVDGRLVRTGNIPVQTAEMEVQAFDPLNKKPLSQRVPASSGQVGSTGDFQLFLSPDYSKYTTFLIVATPKDPAAMVPSKKFEVSVSSILKSPLELGDYGVAQDVRGVATGADGQPIADATVYLEGPVNGGGEYKSQRALTDSSGAFTLHTLPVKDGGAMTLWVIPPAKNKNGIVRKSLPITSTTRDIGEIKAQAKPVLTGSVLLADDTPAAGVRVVAEAIAEAGGGVLPPSGAEALTAEDGTFQLPLDPASYRLDFVPTTPNIPRASRLITIDPASLATLDGVQLSRARTVTGTVSSRPDSTRNDVVKAVPYAGVRFFRVVTLPGQKKSSVLLAESVADAQGNYQVTLPTR